MASVLKIIGRIFKPIGWMFKFSATLFIMSFSCFALCCACFCCKGSIQVSSGDGTGTGDGTGANGAGSSSSNGNEQDLEMTGEGENGMGVNESWKGAMAKMVQEQKENEKREMEKAEEIKQRKESGEDVGEEVSQPEVFVLDSSTDNEATDVGSKAGETSVGLGGAIRDNGEQQRPVDITMQPGQQMSPVERPASLPQKPYVADEGNGRPAEESS